MDKRQPEAPRQTLANSRESTDRNGTAQTAGPIQSHFLKRVCYKKGKTTH